MVALVPKDYFKRWITPLGRYIKSAVRQIAADLDLPTAHNPDSQDLCFRHLLPSFTRSIVFRGDTVGLYTGRPTIGQKRGFRPLQVLDVTQKEILLSDKDVSSTRCRLGEINWLADDVPEILDVQLRSHAQTVSGHINNGELILDIPAILVPGQVAAFYKGNQLLGGAVISSNK